MIYRVVYARRARQELRAIRTYIQGEANALIASRFDGLERYCQELSVFPHRGIVRNDIRPQVRIIGYRRRVSIHFYVCDTEVRILSFTYAGSDWSSHYGNDTRD